MPAVVAKRNARERTRVHTVNQAFLELKHHLPTLRQFTKRVSKLRILNAAINYIEALARVIQNSDTSSSTSLSSTTNIQHYHTHRHHNNHQPSSATVITKPRALRPDTSLVIPQQQQQHQNLYTTTNMFTPQPTHVHHHLPYMKQLLDYPTSYLTTTYPQPSVINPSGVIVTAASNLGLMPTYQCM